MAHQETPLERQRRHELEWQYPTEAIFKLQWQLYQIALRGMEYLSNPERFPVPKPQGIGPKFPQRGDVLDVESIDESQIHP